MQFVLKFITSWNSGPANVVYAFWYTHYCSYYMYIIRLAPANTQKIFFTDWLTLTVIHLLLCMTCQPPSISPSIQRNHHWQDIIMGVGIILGPEAQWCHSRVLVQSWASSSLSFTLFSRCVLVLSSFLQPPKDMQSGGLTTLNLPIGISVYKCINGCVHSAL